MENINRIRIGKLGEDVACRYLITKRYKILGRNYREKFGEIDIIARSEDSTLVFCEVKAIYEKPGYPIQLTPEDNLTEQKLRKMKRIAQFFSAKNDVLINNDRGWRLDFVGIVFENECTIKRIVHYKNV